MSLFEILPPMRGGTLPYAQTRNPSEHLNSSSFSFCEWPRSVLDARLGSGRAQLGEREKMKIGLSVLLGTFVLSAGFAQTAAQAVTLPSKPHAERVLRHVNLPHEKTSHPRKVHKAHKHAHKHVHKQVHWYKHPKKH